MIRIFEGVPGSGKTYAIVYYLKNFCKFDDFYKEWLVPSDTLIISNIEDLKIPYMSFDKLINEFGLEVVFSEDFVKSLWDRGYKKIIFAIDEAQKYFDRKYFNKNVFYFFQYHRHYGVDILLATQDISTLPKEIRVLAEFIIRAEQRSLTLKTFKYKYYTPDDKTYLFSKTLPKDPKVFAMYKSFHAEEVDKPPNILVRQLIIPVFLFFLFIAFAYYFVVTFMFPKPNNAKNTNKNNDKVLSANNPQSNKNKVNQKQEGGLNSSHILVSGYARVGEETFYFSDFGILRDRFNSCVLVGGQLYCSIPPELYRPSLRPPSPMPSSSSGKTLPKGGSGLVNIPYKSHAESVGKGGG